MNRRSLLAVLATGVSGGCLSGDAGDPASPTVTERPASTIDGTDHPAETPTNSESEQPGTPTGSIRPADDADRHPPARECDDSSARRLRTFSGDFQWGDVDGLALRVSDLAVAFGDSVTVTLTNRSGDTVETGTKYHYGVDALTDEGWREVRVSRDGTPEAWQDNAISHEPGEGFTWEFTVREDGLDGAPVHDSSIEVCPALEPGRYRFVYTGAIGSTYPAVAFDVSRPE